MEISLVNDHIEYFLNLYKKIMKVFEIDKNIDINNNILQLKSIVNEIIQNLFFFQNFQIKEILKKLEIFLLKIKMIKMNHLCDIICFLYYDLKIILEDYYFYQENTVFLLEKNIDSAIKLINSIEIFTPKKIMINNINIDFDSLIVNLEVFSENGFLIKIENLEIIKQTINSYAKKYQFILELDDENIIKNHKNLQDIMNQYEIKNQFILAKLKFHFLKKIENKIYNEKENFKNINFEKEKFSRQNLFNLERSIFIHLKRYKRYNNLKIEAIDWINNFIFKNNQFCNEIFSYAPFGSFIHLSDNILSDIDICIITNNMSLLYNIFNFLKEEEEKLDIKEKYFEVKELYFAKNIPLLTIEYKKVKIELNINNSLGVYNSIMIRNYCLIDSRVLMLIILVKDWSKFYNIQGNRLHYLSSYCYTLLTIFFLIQNKVIPHFNSEEKIAVTNDQKNTYILKPNFGFNFDKENFESISELLLKFFIFYSDIFDNNLYKVDITSIDLQRRLECKSKKYTNVFEIVDPFDLNYNPGRYFNKNKSQEEYFYNVIKTSILKIKLNKNIFSEN